MASIFYWLCGLLWYAGYLGVDSSDVASFEHLTSKETSLKQFICRLCPAQCTGFALSLSPRLAANTVQLYTERDVSDPDRNVTVFITSTSEAGIIFGFKQYLEQYCDTSLSEFGLSDSNFTLTELNTTVLLATNSLIRFYGNICAHSYSYWWWNWEQWEQHLDWIAFQGFNLVFVPTGVELINLKVFLALGVTQRQILNFFNGPAYLAWSRMGNMKSFTAPLTLGFLANQVGLQRHITERLNSLGVSIAVPGFTGFVPDELSKMFDPKFFNNVSCWNGFNATFSCLKQIDPTSDFYITVGKIYMDEFQKNLGSNHIYSVDMFNENTPKNSSLDYLRISGSNTVTVMKSTDPFAVWLLQGWTFGYDQFWDNSKIQAYLEGVANDEILVLDMFAESKPSWQRTHSFFGKPFIWTLINNFGGNTVLNGNIMKTVQDFSYACNSSKSLVGFGFMPEGIYQNTILFDAAMQYATVGVQAKSTVSDFFVEWKNKVSSYRYSIPAIKIVRGIVEKLYIDDNGRYYNNCIIYQRPRFNITFTSKSSAQDNVDIILEFLKTIELTEREKISAVLIYDFATVTQNFAERVFAYHYTGLISAYKQNQFGSFERHASIMNKIISLLDDMNSLVPLRSLPCYLHKVEAFAAATNDSAAKLKQDFLLQISVWGSEEGEDYAFKMWSGALNLYYGRRWLVFSVYLRMSMINKVPFDNTGYIREVSSVENEFATIGGFGRCNEFESESIAKIGTLVKQLLETASQAL